MSNQTNKKSPQDRGDNEEKDINMSLRSIWLGKMDGNGTFYSSEYDPQFNIEDIREILDKDEEVDNT